MVTGREKNDLESGLCSTFPTHEEHVNFATVNNPLFQELYKWVCIYTLG